MNGTNKSPMEGIPFRSEKAEANSGSQGNGGGIRVLVADTDSTTLRLLEQHFWGRKFHVQAVNNGVSALDLCQDQEFDVLVADAMLPRLSGLQLLSRLKSRKNRPEVVLVSSQADIETAVEAMRQGAIDFLAKPLKLPVLEEAVRRGFEKRRVITEASSPGRRLNHPRPCSPVESRSSKMREVTQLISKVAKSGSTILITGDSGVGKEIVARTIHKESMRCNNPFIDISCAAIPETLLESELFGYEKGSFTGADSSKPGLFELANGGTLFLDEIGEIGPILQTKLLRVIETRSFFRVGGTRQISVDVRILAATNKDLKQAVEEGKFRKDLYYRLNTISIEVPKLKDRVEDLPLLVSEFVGEFDNGTQRRISDAAMEALERYSWPGNVRELRNVIERALLISPQMLIDVEDLPQEITLHKSPAQPLRKEESSAPASLLEMEKKQIANVLQRTRWHRGRAAELLAISPKTLYRKIKQYELDKISLP